MAFLFKFNPAFLKISNRFYRKVMGVSQKATKMANF
jgi:hypothetical protein